MGTPSSITRTGKHEPFPLQVSRGQITFHEQLFKYGYNPLIINANETVWDVGGLYVYPSSAVAMTVTSVSGATDAGVIGIIVGSIVFSSISQYSSIIDLIIGLAFLWPALRMLNEGIFPQKSKEITGTQIPGTKTAKSVIGSSVGFLTGVTGLCGGYALVPLSIYVLKSNMKIAIGTSLASFLWFALLGTAIKYYQGFVNVPAALTLGIAAAIGAAYGVKLMQKLNTPILKLIFGVIIIYVSIKYILLYFGMKI